MDAVDFTEANCTFGPPPDMAESQVQRIRAHRGVIHGGSCDGMPQTVVAYRPTAEELEEIKAGGLIYFSFFGHELIPHYPSVTFWQATHPA